MKITEAVESGRPKSEVAWVMKSEVAWVNVIVRRCSYSFIDPKIVY